jgi:hypothetical protein
MTDNMIIDIPEIRLPRDMAWRVKFVEAVEDHARRLGITGHFRVPRFLGYYFTGPRAVVVAGLWTVVVDDARLLRGLRLTVEKLTGHRFSIASPEEGGEPEFMLVNDSHDGSCWLWDYAHGRRFLEADEPVTRGGGEDDDLLGEDAGDRPKLLGP